MQLEIWFLQDFNKQQQILFVLKNHSKKSGADLSCGKCFQVVSEKKHNKHLHFRRCNPSFLVRSRPSKKKKNKTKQTKETDDHRQNLLAIGPTSALTLPTPVPVSTCLYFALCRGPPPSLYLLFFTVHISPVHPKTSTCTCLFLLCTLLGQPQFL